MAAFFTILVIGFFLGMRHATDPDHVIAVTTIVTRQRKISRAALTGIVWGIGHTLTIFAVGALIILFDVVIPTRIGLSMDLAVGLMLILLGALNIAGFFRSTSDIASQPQSEMHSHVHRHGDYIHAHAHGHTAETHTHDLSRTPLSFMDRIFGTSGPYMFIRPLVVGIVHGLAGSAAVALLVLATIRDPHWAIAYLLVFGIGTIAGMMLITMSIASAFHFAGKGRDSFSRKLSFASGLISLLFGLFIAYQSAIGGGLFTGHPFWTPS